MEKIEEGNIHQTDRDQIDLQPIMQSLGTLLRIIQIKAHRRFYRELAGFAISPGSFTVLELIRANPGIRQGTVASLLAVQESNMTTLVQKLVSEKLVVSRQSEVDRRQSGLWICEEGERLLQETEANVRQLERSLAEGMRDSSYRALLESLGAIYRASL